MDRSAWQGASVAQTYALSEIPAELEAELAALEQWRCRPST